MIRQSIIVVSLALVLGASGDLRQIFTLSSDRAQFDETCEFYTARAAGARGFRGGDFIVFLSELCAAAETSLDEGTRQQRGRAAQLLMRIVRLRHTINQMNAERAGDLERARVTPAGEFLIAHRIGVMDAFDAWLDSGAEFSLASYP